jgi:phosphopantothenoylcysteine decarboxylase/phosphopantothenate--cysteine ligase
MIAGKRLTVGITGGIAAYKAADIVSWLSQQGAYVQVVMTEAACRIITPLTLKTLSGRPVACDIFSEEGDFAVPHIDVAECDAFIVLPATANILAKAAGGLADDLLSAALLATTAPVIFAPAMNMNMYAHPATRYNIGVLRERGCLFIEPAEGRLACGTVGKGRLPDVETLKSGLMRLLEKPAPLLEGKKVLVTAGPTHEYLDPVRYIGNRSSGKMGYALAAAAAAAGAKVTLISGPTALSAPPGLAIERVLSADEMFDAVWRHYPACDIVIMTAAVADYKPEQLSAQKIKKGREQSLTLSANRDILASLGRNKGNKILIGFAAETESLIEQATKKLQEKNLDMIVANNVLTEGAGFDNDTNIVSVIHKAGEVDEWPILQKRELAQRLIEEIAKTMNNEQ